MVFAKALEGQNVENILNSLGAPAPAHAEEKAAEGEKKGIYKQYDIFVQTRRKERRRLRRKPRRRRRRKKRRKRSKMKQSEDSVISSVEMHNSLAPKINNTFTFRAYSGRILSHLIHVIMQKYLRFALLTTYILVIYHS